MTSTDSNGLTRRLGFLSVVAIIVADIIGTGIFTTSGLLMNNIQDPSIMLLLWGVGGLIALTGAFCYAELSTAMPYAGGEYLFISRLIHPSLGFLSGWISFIVGFSAPVAATSIGIGEYLTAAFPELFSSQIIPGIPADMFFQKGIAFLVIAVFTFLHLQGLKRGGKIHNIFTVVKIALVIGIIVLGFSFGDGSFEHFSMESSGKGTFKAAGLSVIWIMFAYSGWNAAAYIGSEVKNPRKNLPRALIAGTGIVIFLYLLINILFIYALPPDEMAGVVSIGGAAAKSLFGEMAGKIFSVLVAIILFSSVSALIILGPRIYYAMAKNNHFFKFAARINPKTGVPSQSILVQGGLAVIIALSGTFSDILTYMGFALGIFPIVAVTGLFILRRKKLDTYKSPLFPVLPIFFILINLLILTLSFADSPLPSSIALSTIIVGIPLYMIFNRRNK